MHMHGVTLILQIIVNIEAFWNLLDSFLYISDQGVEIIFMNDFWSLNVTQIFIIRSHLSLFFIAAWLIYFRKNRLQTITFSSACSFLDFLPVIVKLLNPNNGRRFRQTIQLLPRNVGLYKRIQYNVKHFFLTIQHLFFLLSFYNSFPRVSPLKHIREGFKNVLKSFSYCFFVLQFALLDPFEVLIERLAPSMAPADVLKTLHFQLFSHQTWLDWRSWTNAFYAKGKIAIETVPCGFSSLYPEIDPQALTRPKTFMFLSTASLTSPPTCNRAVLGRFFCVAPSYIIEIQIHSFWGDFLQCLGNILGFVVDKMVKTQLFC